MKDPLSKTLDKVIKSKFVQIAFLSCLLQCLTIHIRKHASIGSSTKPINRWLEGVAEWGNTVETDGKIGTYQIIHSENYITSCEGIDLSDFSSTIDMEAKNDRLTGTFSNSRDKLKEREPMEWVTGNLMKFIIPGVLQVVSLILFLVCLFKFIAHLISSCCCFCSFCPGNGKGKFKATSMQSGIDYSIKQGDDLEQQKIKKKNLAAIENAEKEKEEREKQKKQCCAKCCNYSRWPYFIISICLIIIVIVLMFLWMGKMNKALDNIDTVFCGTSNVFSEIVNGVETVDIQFSGLKGFTYVLNTALDEIKNVVKLPEIDKLKAIPIKAKSDFLNSEIEAYVTFFKTKTVLDPVTRTTNLIPTSINTLTPKINTYVETELDVFAQLAKELDTGVTFLYDIRGSLTEIDTFTDSINSVTTMLGDISDSVIDADDLLNGKDVDLKGKVETTQMVLKITVFAVQVLQIFFVAMTIVTHGFGRCLKCVGCAQKTVMFIFSLLTFIFALCAFVFICISAVSANLCVISYDFQNDYQTLVTVFSDNQEMFNLTKECIAANGTGNITSIFNADTGGGAFDDVNGQFTMLTEYEEVLNNYTSNTEFLTLKQYDDTLDLMKTFMFNDFDLYPDTGYKKALENINLKVISLNDHWVLNEKDCPDDSYVKWDTTQSATYLNDDSKVCINLISFLDKPYTMAERYSGTSITAEDITSVTNMATNLRAFVTDYHALIDDMTGPTGTKGLNVNSGGNKGANVLGSEFLVAFKSMNAGIYEVRDKMVGLQDFVNSFVTGLDGFLNCRILRRELTIFQNSFCYSFIDPFVIQSSFQFSTTICIFFLTICLCCTITYPTKQRSTRAKIIPIKHNDNDVSFDQDAENRAIDPNQSMLSNTPYDDEKNEKKVVYSPGVESNQTKEQTLEISKNFDENRRDSIQDTPLMGESNNQFEMAQSYQSNSKFKMAQNDKPNDDVELAQENEPYNKIKMSQNDVTNDNVELAQDDEPNKLAESIQDNKQNIDEWIEDDEPVGKVSKIQDNKQIEKDEWMEDDDNESVDKVENIQNAYTRDGVRTSTKQYSTRSSKEALMLDRQPSIKQHVTKSRNSSSFSTNQKKDNSPGKSKGPDE